MDYIKSGHQNVAPSAHISARGFSLQRPISDLEDYARVLVRLVRRHGPESCYAATLADVLDELKERRGGHDWRGQNVCEKVHTSDEGRPSKLSQKIDEVSDPAVEGAADE